MSIKKLGPNTYGIIYKNIKIKTIFGKVRSTDELTPKILKCSLHGYDYISINKLKIENFNIANEGIKVIHTNVSSVENNVIYEETSHNFKRHPDSWNKSIVGILGHLAFQIKSSIGISWITSDKNKIIILENNPQEAKMINEISMLIDAVKEYKLELK
jgi:ribosomal protein L30/L7E